VSQSRFPAKPRRLARYYVENGDFTGALDVSTFASSFRAFFAAFFAFLAVFKASFVFLDILQSPPAVRAYPRITRIRSDAWVKSPKRRCRYLAMSILRHWVVVSDYFAAAVAKRNGPARVLRDQRLVQLASDRKASLSNGGWVLRDGHVAFGVLTTGIEYLPASGLHSPELRVAV
jgi:hypothetical protein